MDEDADRKRDIAESFGRQAANYVDSRTHRDGDDLETLANWVAGATRVLDVATGAGHTGGAVLRQGVPEVVATDAATDMVTTATVEYPGLRGVTADAERLPFETGAFDAVTCRIAAHHFPAPEAFVSEVARVLNDGGVFAFEDNVAPPDDDLDAFLNEVERIRDPSHVRSYTVTRWLSWLDAAGFDVETTTVVPTRLEFQEWMQTQDVAPSTRETLRELFSDPPEGAAELYSIEYEDGDVAAFANLKLLLRATR